MDISQKQGAGGRGSRPTSLSRREYCFWGSSSSSARRCMVNGGLSSYACSDVLSLALKSLSDSSLGRGCAGPTSTFGPELGRFSDHCSKSIQTCN